MTEQLGLDLDLADPREPFAFIAVCWRCGARSEPIPAESAPGVWPADNWWTATCWATVALTTHDRECPALAGTTPPTTEGAP